MGCLPGSLETARSVQKLQKHNNKVVAAGDPELWAVCAERLAGGFREPSHLSPSGGRFCAENGQTKGPLLSATPRQHGTQRCGFPPCLSLLGEDLCLQLGCGVPKSGYSRKTRSPSTGTFWESTLKTLTRQYLLNQTLK